MASVEPTPVPFWGESDSNIQWCEEDYAVTPYVAEFWNTLSSIPLFLWGVFGVFMYYRHSGNEKRFASLFLCLSAVGFGSFLFHCTMRRHAQVLDEAPMLYANFIFLFCLFDKRETPRPWLAYASVVACVILTGIYLLLPNFYWVFLTTYSSMVIFITVWSIYLVSTNTPTTPGEWHLPITALALYLTGTIIWSRATALALFFLRAIVSAFENMYCDLIPSWLQLHAMWHLLAGFGTYHYILWLVALRAKEFYLPSTLVYGPGYTTAVLYVGDHKPLKEV